MKLGLRDETLRTIACDLTEMVDLIVNYDIKYDTGRNSKDKDED